MRLGLCYSILKADDVADTSADFLEQHIQQLLVPTEGEEAFAPHREAVQRAGRPLLAANCFLPADIPSAGPDLDVEKICAYAERACARAAEVGIRSLVYGSGASRTIPDGFSHARAADEYVDLLGMLGPIAQRHQVTFVVEPLQFGECNLINTVDEGADVVRRVAHAHVLLLVDLFHMLRNDERPETIRRNRGLIRHAHIAEKDERTAPGEKGDDFRPYLQALRDIGYEGGLAIEPRWQDVKAQAEPGLQELRRQLRDVGYEM
jgi:sugar phosphate isomerase/epimerase